MVEILSKAKYLGRMHDFSADTVEYLREAVDDFRYILPNIIINDFAGLSDNVSQVNLSSPVGALIERTDFLQQLRDKPYTSDLDQLYELTLFFQDRIDLNREKQSLMKEIRALYSTGKPATPTQ